MNWKFVLFCFDFLAIPCGTQGLFLTPCSEITPGLLGPYGMARAEFGWLNSKQAPNPETSTQLEIS